MLKATVDLNKFIPIGREFAAEIASVASQYTCTLTLEHDGIVLNLKSMIGLLSQSVPSGGVMTLVADGEDEAAALSAILSVMQG